MIISVSVKSSPFPGFLGLYRRRRVVGNVSIRQMSVEGVAGWIWKRGANNAEVKAQKDS